MPPTLSTPCQRLQEADQAYHDLTRGAGVRSVTDENGENVQYSMARRADLLIYIQALQAQCPAYQATALGAGGATRAPMRFLF